MLSYVMGKTTLRALLGEALEDARELPDDIRRITLPRDPAASVGDGCQTVNYDELARFEGSAGFGGTSFPNVYAWTDKRVYFKVVYDGSEYVDSVPRDPVAETPSAFGGG